MDSKATASSQAHRVYVGSLPPCDNDQNFDSRANACDAFKFFDAVIASNNDGSSIAGTADADGAAEGEADDEAEGVDDGAGDAVVCAGAAGGGDPAQCGHGRTPMPRFKSCWAFVAKPVSAYWSRIF